MINWRGIPYYVGKSIFTSQKWRTSLREVRRSDIEQLSSEYLRVLLRHACENVPYYRSLGLVDAALAQYPLLLKGQIREAPALFERDDLVNRQWARISTSGSTGEAVVVLGDPDCAAWREATSVWYLEELLSTPHYRMVAGRKVRLWRQRDLDGAWPSLAIRLVRWLAPRTWLDPFAALSEEALLSYGRTINRMKPRFIWAFSGALYELARTALLRNLKLHRPRFIISSGETLHTFMRPVIEEAFGCRVYDSYGSAEAGHVAGECHAGNLHVFSFSSKVEVLDPVGQAVGPGEAGRLVITPLHSYAMPLIRYDTADIAQVGPAECSCGCQLPTLQRILGRAVEFFVTQDGSLISGGRFGKLLNRCSWILSYQILQEDVDHITVYFKRMAKEATSSEDMARLGGEISKAIGTRCRVDWQEVEEIPRTANGKRPYARSLVWESRQPVDLWTPL